MRLYLTVVLALTASPLLARGIAPRCDIGDAEPVVVKQITPHFEFALDDGRLIKIPGLGPFFPQDTTLKNPALLDKITAELEARSKNEVVLVREISPLPDRWGRITGQVAFLTDAGEPEALAPLILAQGGAIVKPEPEISTCKDAYLAAEKQARETAAGLWSDGSFTVYPADAPDTLEGMGGKFVIVEGKPSRYGEGDVRVFLDFGKRRGIDFSVTVLKKGLKSFARGGSDLGALVGKNIRVRGILDTRFEPRMEIFSPDAIEVLE